MKRFCEFCGEKSLSLELHTEHTLGCKENPRNKPKPKPKKPKSQVLSELVSDNVKTLDDIPRLVSEVMLKEGYEVVFQSIPDRWSDKPYSNPYNVRFPNDEKIYAGWTGNWRGTITPLKVNTRRKPEITISDLSSTWSDGTFSFKFIRTESGSSGKDFNISGHILVDDFPHLHREYLVDGFTKRYDDEMKEKLSEVTKNTRRVEKEYIDSDMVLKEVRFEIDNVADILATLNGLKNKRELELMTKHRGETLLELPKIECPFIDMRGYIELQKRYEDKEVILTDNETLEAVDALSNTIERANKFANDRLESFI